MSKIHVVIPVYNAKKYLQQAVDSVLDQPYKGIDIVLVDDGSTDGSAELCDEIAQREERVNVIHQANGGVSSARNTGIEHVLKNAQENDYIAFLDADDFWTEDCFSHDFSFKLKKNHDILAFGSIVCNEMRSRYSRPSRYSEECIAEGYRSIWSVSGTFCACLYKVDLISKWDIRFFQDIKYCEDKIFQMQCVFLAKEICYMTTVLHVCRENSGSAMRRAITIAPIDYYFPIINGWIKSDEFVNKWSDATGIQLKSGCVLAGIYFVDMAMDHYKRWGSRGQVEKVMRNHPHYHLMLEFNEQDVKPYQLKKRNLLVNHPMLFKMKYNAIGAVEFFARLALRIKPVRELRLRRKYPLSTIPNNR